ncbi:MAG: FUSC family protein [Anaerovoracaceae bacterium]
MKKIMGTVASKTIMFLVAVGTVLLSRSVFGEINVIVTVGLFTQALVFLTVDLTKEPLKNFLKILFVDLLLGVASTVVQMDPILGLVVNLLLIFGVVYIFMKDLSTPMYFPFMLTYLFMMGTAPVPFGELPLRLMLLAAGAVVTMLLQLVANGKKSKNLTNQTIESVVDKLIEEIEQWEEGEIKEETVVAVSEEVRNLAKFLDNRKTKAFFVSSTVMEKLNIAICLERIGLHLKEADKEKHVAVVQELKAVLIAVNAFIKGTVDKEGFAAVMKGFADHCALAHGDYFTYELVEVTKLLEKTTYLLVNKRKDKAAREEKQPKKKAKDYRTYHLIKESFDPTSIRFSFAFRSAIGVSLAFFATQYFQLEYGRWMMYTMFAIIQPYGSDAKDKFKDRVIGTTIGLVGFVILFGIFRDPLSRSVVMMATGYVCSYMTTYAKQTIFVTISALGVAAMADPSSQSFELERLLFVLVGGAVAMLINRFVFHATVEKTTERLKTRYKVVTKELFRSIFLPKEEKTDKNEVANLVLTGNLIEDKLVLNNTKLENQQLQQFIENQRLLINDILFLGQNDTALPGEITKDVLRIMEGETQLMEETCDKIKTEFERSTVTAEKIQLIGMGDIVKEVKTAYIA